MENVKSFFKDFSEKAIDFLMEVVKTTATSTTKLLAKGSGKAAEFVGGKVKKVAVDYKQPLLLVAMAVSAAAMLTSGVFYLLGRKK